MIFLRLPAHQDTFVYVPPQGPAVWMLQRRLQKLSSRVTMVTTAEEYMCPNLDIQTAPPGPGPYPLL